MKINFIGQGFNSEDSSSVAQCLIESLDDDNFHTFKCLVAFTSHSGANGLKHHVVNSKSHISNFRIITGIDQMGTSKEALESLLEWDVECFIFFTTQRIIFHPKIYIFEGDEMARIIVGSNNLTQTGLTQNIEGSLEYTFRKSEVEDDSNILDQINNYYSDLMSGESHNLKRLTQYLINSLVEEGVVPTEASRRAQYLKESRASENSEGNTDFNLRENFPSFPIQPLPADFLPISISIQRSIGFSDEEFLGTQEEMTEYGELVWEKENLPGSDVQYSASGNPTGGLRLVQAKYKIDGEAIDQTAYFRHIIFGDEIWVVANQHPFREVSEVNFQIIINGRFAGSHRLNVRHKPSGESGQGNYTTLISWGTASPKIGELDLRGKTLRLFKHSENGRPFTITIS